MRGFGETANDPVDSGASFAKIKDVGPVKVLDPSTLKWRDATKVEAAGHAASVDLPTDDEE